VQPRPPLAGRGNTNLDDIFGTVDRLLQGSTAMQQNTSRFEQSLNAANDEIRRLRTELSRCARTP
jgi:ABC-type transporter Mla subunit MlaD